MPLTPKQKAEELLNKYRRFVDGIDPETDRFSPRIEKTNGKLISIEVVNEILYFMYRFDLEENMNVQYQYWEQVKEEVEKL